MMTKILISKDAKGIVPQKTEPDYRLNELFNLIKCQFLNKNCALNI